MAALSLTVLGAGTATTDHILNADGSRDYLRSVLGVTIEQWSERGYFECRAHLEFAQARPTPLLLSRCSVFGCTDYEPEFYETGC